MTVISLKFFLTFVFILTFCFSANAQDDASTSNGRPTPKQDLPVGIQETLAKGRIKQAEKEYKELVTRGEEAAALGEELSKTLESGQKFSSEDKKKIERLEKLIKRIRTDLGAEDDNQKGDEKDQQMNLSNVIKNIQEDTANLLSEIKRIGRHTISVIAIESSNSVLKLIRFLRFNSN
jgi:septal ring factor EnvC (AmiA/AmiB activator)